MTRFIPLVVPMLVMYAGARIWAHRHRNLSIAELFELPWWQWPLVRLAIRRWKNAAHLDNLWKWCKYDEPPRTTTYISIRGWEWDDFGFQRRAKVPWVKLRVAPGFPQGDEETDDNKNPKRELVNQARGDFDLGSVDDVWNFRFLCRHVVLTPKEVVPHVALGMAPDVAAVVAANLATDTVVPAIGKGDRPITHSTTNDASHVLVSGTTMGGGKSETLKTFALQSYAPSILSGREIPGADLLIVDTTRKFSHTGWAVDYETGKPWPGITIATELDQAAGWLTYAARVMEERGEITRQEKTKGNNIEWSRLVILLDDVNGLMKGLRERGHDRALLANSMLLWHARGVNMYRVDAFQRGSAQAAGGGDNREAYGCRIWADGSEKTGDMLADAVDKKSRPKPKPHTVQPGHSVFIYGSLAFEAQRILYEDDEARRICTAEARRRRHRAIDATSRVSEGGNPSGVPGAPGSWRPTAALPATTFRTPPSPRSDLSGFPPSLSDDLSMQQIDVRSAIDEVDGEVNYLTLRDISLRDWCPVKYHTIRSYARDSDLGESDFPAPIKGFENPRRWSERDVRDWFEARAIDAGEPGVYVIDPPGSAVVKIGETKDLEGRVDQLSLSGLADQVVKQWFPCRDKQHSQALEDWLHDQYKRQRVSPKAEWFRKEGRLARDYQDRDRLLAGCPRELLPEVVRS